jgi:hypothetical protein
MYRNVRLATPPPQPPAASSHGRSVIAVIGIDHYATWPRLQNAVNDARGAARVFTQLGFTEVTGPLLDGAATGEAMRRLITTDFGRLTADDSLVVFFAGHGHTDTARFDDIAVKTGYLIPADGEEPGGDGKNGRASWLRLDSWLSDVARLPPRHILVVIDACHSGVALSELHKWRGQAGPAGGLEALQARRSRCVITSALDDQRAMDGGPYPGHSLFTGCLIEGLSGGLGDSERRAVTGREIGEYLQRRVRSYPHTEQTPDFGAFELDDRGDLIVPILSPEAATEAAPDASMPSRAPPPSTGSSPAPQPQAPPRRIARRWWLATAGVASLASASLWIHGASGGDREVRQPPARSLVRDATLELPEIEIKAVEHHPQALLEARVPYIKLPRSDSGTDLVAAQRARIASTADPVQKRAQSVRLAALLYRAHHNYSSDVQAPELAEARQIVRDVVQKAGVRNVDDTVLQLLGACEVLLQYYPAAEQTWQALVDRNPAGKDAAYQRAWLVYAQLRQHKAAAALATVAGQPLDGSPELAYVAAWARWWTGDTSGAWQAIATAARQWVWKSDTDCVDEHMCLVPLRLTSFNPLPSEVRRFVGQADIALEQAAAVMKVLLDGTDYATYLTYAHLGLSGYGPAGRWALGLAALDRAVEVSKDVMLPNDRVAIRTAQADYASRLGMPDAAARYAALAVDALALCKDSCSPKYRADTVLRLYATAQQFREFHVYTGDPRYDAPTRDLYAMTIPLLDNGATRAQAQREAAALQADGATAETDETRRRGLSQLVMRHNEEVRIRFEQALGAHPQLHGTIALVLEVDPGGAVQAALAGPAADADLVAVARDVAEQVKQWKFPAHLASGTAHVRLSYALAAPDAQDTTETR